MNYWVRNDWKQCSFVVFNHYAVRNECKNARLAVQAGRALKIGLLIVNIALLLDILATHVNKNTKFLCLVEKLILSIFHTTPFSQGAESQ